MVFERNDCRELNEGETYENHFVVIKASYFKEEYREAKNQLFYAVGGFGCDPTKIGNAVFGNSWDESYRQERYNIIGVATEDAIEMWEKEYGMSRDILKR